MKRTATVASIVVAALLLWAAATRHSRPVLIRVPFRTNPVMVGYNYAVFNPFRDRSAERSATAYIEAMRRGDCSEAAKYSRNVVLPNSMDCEQMQAEHRDYRAAFVQRLRDRSDGEYEVTLYYSNNGYEGNWVTVKRVGDSWSVVEFNKFW
jgi:hypothetical protein